MVSHCFLGCSASSHESVQRAAAARRERDARKGHNHCFLSGTRGTRAPAAPFSPHTAHVSVRRGTTARHVTLTRMQGSMLVPAWTEDTEICLTGLDVTHAIHLSNDTLESSLTCLSTCLRTCLPTYSSTCTPLYIVNAGGEVAMARDLRRGQKSEPRPACRRCCCSRPPLVRSY